MANKKIGITSSAADNFLAPCQVTGFTATGVNGGVFGSGTATLSWSASNPAICNPATSYSIVSSPATTTQTTSSTSLTFPGLSGGTAYTFTITPINAIGNGPTTTSNSVTPTTAPATPGAPTATSTVALYDSVTWSAPANGGSAITGYTLRSSDGPTYSTAATSYSVAETANTAQTYQVLATNASGSSPYSAMGNSVTTLAPSFFSPPFFPPSFFSPPGFFAPPGFWCIDEDTLIQVVGPDDSISFKKAKDITLDEEIWSVVWDGLEDELAVDPFTWQADSIENITNVKSRIKSIKSSVKDATMIINGNQDQRFSLEQTILIKKQDKYFFGTTGSLEPGDSVFMRNEDNVFVEVLVESTTGIDEPRTVYQFDAAPNDIIIAGGIIVHNAKGD